MVLACLFLMLSDRYFFDLLRWTLGRAERTARAGVRNSRKPIITQAADCRLPIADCRFRHRRTLSGSPGDLVNTGFAKSTIGNQQLAIDNVLPYSGRSVV
jgi:hypothetical protein